MDKQTFELLMKRFDTIEDNQKSQGEKLDKVLEWKSKLSTRLSGITAVTSTIASALVSFVIQLFITKTGK